jgi:hypothetical protein
LSNEARAELEKVQAEQKARLLKPRSVGKRLFNVQKQRIIANITLKLYKHMLDPLMSELNDTLSAFVLKQDESQMRNLFNQNALTENWYKHKSDQERVLGNLAETKENYQRISTLFLTLVKPLERTK